MDFLKVRLTNQISHIDKMERIPQPSSYLVVKHKEHSASVIGFNWQAKATDRLVKLNRDLNKPVRRIDVITNIVIRAKCALYKARHGDLPPTFNADDW